MKKLRKELKEMKKEIIIEKRENAINFFMSENAYHEPRQFDNSNGNGGKAFELCVKDYANSKSATVSKGERADLVKYVNGKRCVFECKTGGGVLCTVDENGNTSGYNCDFVIYLPKFEKNTYVGNAMVYPADAFIKALEMSKMIRPKRSSYMQKRYKAGLSWYYDRITIQSPKGRDSAVAKLLSYGTSLDDFWEMTNL